jgi:twitching motility protein PilT
MRDPDTISAALTAAETGHLVFATLHTNDAAQTIDRIVDSFPPHQQNQVRYQLASSLIGILSRRLVPKIGGGIINAVELLVVNSAARNLIRENKIYQIPSIIETSFEEGMISLNRSLADLVKREIISMDVAMSFSSNPNELKLMI